MNGLPLEIKYGTDQHSTILRAVLERLKFSEGKMAERYSKWKEADELFRSYVPESEEQASRRASRKKGEAQYLTLNIPYSYAVLLTAHTYWASVFLGRDPVFQYDGRHGETQQKVQAVEALIDYQLTVGEMLVPLYIWLLDAGKYGIGIVGNYWADEQIAITEIVNQPVTFMGEVIEGKTERIRRTVKMPGYSGNKLFNVRPYDFFPDPRVSILNFQQGEFCGRRTQVGWNEIMRRAATGEYFNIEALDKLMAGQGWTDREQGSSALSLPAQPSENPLKGSLGGRGFNDLVEMTIELVPSEWKLTKSNFPEKWVFTMAGNSVIIGCRPQGLVHNKFPFHIQSYELEAYSHQGRGMLEILQPLNDTLSWLVNSHYFNVRKSLNDQFIVDPSRVVMKDLTDGGPGKLIRLQPSAYGQDVRTIITQFPVMDITQGNLRDIQLIEELIQRVTGVTDNLQGMVNAGGRKTATEIRSSSSFGVNRLKTHSEFNSALGFSPLSQMLLTNTQQLYDDEKQFRIAGDLTQQGGPIIVRPEDLQGFYDYVPVDGTMPIDRYAQANLWKEIIFGLAKMPQLAMQFDLAGIFTWMAQLAGLKNITQFKVQVQPDAVILAQAQAGSLVPQAGGLPSGTQGLPGDLGTDGSGIVQ